MGGIDMAELEKHSATIIDLRMELWYRMRERNLIVWKTKDGTEIPINEMSDLHLLNAFKSSIRYNTKIQDDMALDYNDTLALEHGY